MDVHVYKNYVFVIIELCWQHNMVEILPIFHKLFTLLGLSGLFFPLSVSGSRVI